MHFSTEEVDPVPWEDSAQELVKVLDELLFSIRSLTHCYDDEYNPDKGSATRLPLRPV